MSTTPSSRPGRRPDPALRQQWQKRLERFHQSGLSVAAFCVRERISAPSFYSWRRRLDSKPDFPRPPRSDHAPPHAAPRLLPVHILPPSPSVEVVLPTGPILRVAPGTDLAFLRSLVDALGGERC